MGKTISLVKGKGSISHDNREFIAENIDEDRIEWNETYIKEPIKEAYEKLFGEAVADYNSKQKRSDRKIDNYMNKIKNSRNNEKVFYENVVQIGKKDDTGVLDADGNLSQDAAIAKEVLREYAKTFQERNPNLYLFNAVLHMDEATPHLHLDYIPVAHGYKTGMETRNSLTKALQEQGIAGAVSKTDTETMHWQKRERDYLTQLCQEHGIEVDVVGVDRDSYSIPEYKEAMREKEEAEAEVEILNAEKTEIKSAIALIDTELDSGKEELEKQKKMLDEINNQISDAEKRAENKVKAMDKIIAAGKPVEKEIREIKSKAAPVTQIFGGEPMIKIPESVFDKMIARYRVAGTFEKLNEDYCESISAKQGLIDKLKEQNIELRTKIRKYDDFLGVHGLVERFAEFIKPKSIKEKLEINKKTIHEVKERTKPRITIPKKHHNVAI